MINLNAYRFTRILSVICFIAILYRYWGISFIGFAFMLFPYIITLLLANQGAYQTKFNILLRTSCGVLIAILALGLLLETGSDPQAGIGIGFGVVIQYGVIFVSEAIIGIASYKKTSV